MRPLVKNLPMNNPSAADPNSSPAHPMLAEEDVRNQAVRWMRNSIRALATSMIGVILWMSLIGIVEDPLVRLATPIFGAGIERFVVPFLMLLSFGVFLLPIFALYWFCTRKDDVCPACGSNHATQHAWILRHRICPICREEILDRRGESEEEYLARQNEWGTAEQSAHLAWFMLVLPTMIAVSWLVDSSHIEASPHSMMWAAILSSLAAAMFWLLSRNRRVALPFVLSLAYLAIGIWIFMRL